MKHINFILISLGTIAATVSPIEATSQITVENSVSVRARDGEHGANTSGKGENGGHGQKGENGQDGGHGGNGGHSYFGAGGNGGNGGDAD